MTQFLARLSATQQVGALFVLVFGLLLIASIVLFMLSIREHDDPVQEQAWRASLRHCSSAGG